MDKWKKVGFVFAAAVVCTAVVLLFHWIRRKRDLAETLLWMDRTYDPHEGGDNFGQGHGWEIHYSRNGQEQKVTEKFRMTIARLGGCKIAINSETLPIGVFSETPSATKYTVNLCDVDPESIKINTYDPYKDAFSCDDPGQVKLYELDCSAAEVVFKARNDAALFVDDYRETFLNLTGKDREARTVSKTNKCLLMVDDVTYARRLAKALKHAVELCGGERSKF